VRPGRLPPISPIIASYRIPRTARSKALTIVEPIDAPVNTKAVKWKTPGLHLISSDNLDELIDLIINEAKVNLRLLSVDFFKL
jgi:hypothetical protein